MKTIWKFRLNVQDVVKIEMPRSSKVLSVAKDPGGNLCVWAAVDTNNQMVWRTFRIAGTGNSIEDIESIRSKFVGTVVSGIFVWHVFVD